MEFSTTCPACGAALALESATRRVTCKYCGNQFEVDTSTALPGLTPLTPDEMRAEPLPEQSAQSESADILLPPPPIFHTAEPDFPAPPPAYTPVPSAAPKKMGTTWVVVAIGVALLLCGLCSCLLIASLFPVSGISF